MAQRSLQPGTDLGPYEVIDLLGAGGMGEVYRARDSRLERDVAVKVLPPQLAGDPSALDRFRREARAVASLSHPNILAIFDIGSQHGVHFAVSELLEGQTLRRRLATLGPFDPAEAVRIMIEIADGVAAAHARGIIHRDLKPENIFITDTGRIKVLDFGLAKPDSSVTTSHSRTTAFATETGAIVGTVGYLSPEQMQARPLTPAADVFTLGCVLYEMIEGALPFRADTPMMELAAVLRDPAPHLDSRGDPLRGAIDAIIQRCLAKEPADRLPDAAAFADALRATRERSTLRSLPIVLPAKKRRALTTAVAVIAVLAAIGFAAVAYVRHRDRVIDQGYDLRASDIRADSETRRLVEYAMRADADGNRPHAMELLEEATRRSSSPLPPAILATFTDAIGDHAALQRWSAEARRRLTRDSPPYESLLVRYMTARGSDLARDLAVSNSILSIRPRAWRLRLSAAHNHLNRADRAAALAELKQIDIQQPDDRRLSLVLADRASLGDIEGAERDLQRSSLRARPHLLHYTQARIAWSRGDAASAQALFRKAAEAAAVANFPSVELETRMYETFVAIARRQWTDAEQLLAVLGPRARQLGNVDRDYVANGFGAYVAWKRGDATLRDAKLAAAFNAVPALERHDRAALRLLALRSGSRVWMTWPMPDTAPHPELSGVAELIRSREAFAEGNREAAVALLQRSRAEGIAATIFREEAELLAQELGLPHTLFPADPPYPNILRLLAVLDLREKT